MQIDLLVHPNWNLWHLHYFCVCLFWVGSYHVCIVWFQGRKVRTMELWKWKWLDDWESHTLLFWAFFQAWGPSSSGLHQHVFQRWRGSARNPTPLALYHLRLFRSAWRQQSTQVRIKLTHFMSSFCCSYCPDCGWLGGKNPDLWSILYLYSCS